MKHLIFDFDGTIVDNLSQVIVLLHKNLLPKGIDLNQYGIENLRQIGVAKFMKQAKVSKLELFQIYQNIKQEIRQHLNDYPPVKRLTPIIAKLSTQNMLYIFSSNTAENIKSYLTEYKLDTYFRDIIEDSSYFGKHIGLKKFTKSLKLDPNNVFYIGDESRDIIAAHKAELKSVAVSWGFEGAKPLIDANPDYLLNNPEELLML